MAFGPKPWKDKPDGTTPISAAGLIDLETRLAAYTDAEAAAAISTAPPIVTTLPASPTAGQVVRYRHTAGESPWLCVWDPALNGGAGAWAVQGPPLVAASEGVDRSTSSLTFVAIAGMPEITIPVAGLWRIEMGAIWMHSQAGGWGVLAAAPATDDASMREQAAVASIWQRTRRARGVDVPLSAGVVSVVGRSAGGTATWRDIDLAAHPVELRP
jgi:hypothetical protein